VQEQRERYKHHHCRSRDKNVFVSRMILSAYGSETPISNCIAAILTLLERVEFVLGKTVGLAK
jgi:hypothetical protein